MTQNLITSAFELVRDVEHGVLLLDTFYRLATREVLLLHLLPPPLLLLCSCAFLRFLLSLLDPILPHALSSVLDSQGLFFSLCSPGFQIAKECDSHNRV